MILPPSCARLHRRLRLVAALALGSSLVAAPEGSPPPNPTLTYAPAQPRPGDRVISRQAYWKQLQGFWLGQCIANWTGLVTELDKVGDTGPIKTGPFYTRQDWGGPDQPNIWSGNQPSPLSPTIDFVFEKVGGTWGADDDTDIEYIYQALLLENRTSLLSGEQIRTGWLKHIRVEEENYLWVSNQRAFDLMRQGVVPPATGDPANNPDFEMIDAQLTTEIFGLFTPGRPDVGMRLARLPIQTTARYDAQWIAEFYVRMHALAATSDPQQPMGARLRWMADMARRDVPPDSYTAKMYDFVKSRHAAGIPWEQTRDEIYQRYQVAQADGYDLTARRKEANGGFAAGINFASSLVSLFYGDGDLKETIKIGTLAGWDSDNPTATWGGLIGFMLGKAGVEQAFGHPFADRFNIHRTRIGFANDGIDDFANMALHGVWVIDRVVQEQLNGSVDLEKDVWYIPAAVTPPQTTAR